jgi:DNA-binding MarR family transcriptional regulator
LRHSDVMEQALSFPQLIKWAEMVTRAEAEQAMAGAGISSGQLFVLVLLGQRGEATAADLARMMRLTPQALTKLVGPLREGGLLTARTDAGHARRQLLSLTSLGASKLAEARTASARVEEALLADFSADERSQLKALLARVARRFDHG